LETETRTAIVTDSSCDLSDEQLKRYNIRMIPLRIICQNTEYRDRIDLSPDEIYDIMDRELPEQAFPWRRISIRFTNNCSGWLYGRYPPLHLFRLKRHVEHDPHFCPGLSRPFEYRVIDTKTLSTGLGYMVLAAARALEEGADADTAVQAAQAARSTQLVCS
jgi:fatty acid-binding protein DegV